MSPEIDGSALVRLAGPLATISLRQLAENAGLERSVVVNDVRKAKKGFGLNASTNVLKATPAHRQPLARVEATIRRRLASRRASTRLLAAFEAIVDRAHELPARICRVEMQAVPRGCGWLTAINVLSRSGHTPFRLAGS